MSLHDLERQWRERATQNAADGDHATSKALRQCAAELRAALAVGGEAVAWQCRSAWGDGFTEWQYCSKEDYDKRTPLLVDHRGNPLATQFRALFTHPAGAVGGAVELSDAQCDAITDALDDTAWGYQDARIAIRYALKSTLNPGGSRE